jgi:hypothetical protein
VLSRSVDQSATDDKKLCVEKLAVTGEATEGDYVEDCPYISSLYAICDTHPYNAGKTEIPSDTEALEEIKEIVGLKITVVSQQMYKQYEYINATLRRLKTQLEKAVVVSTLEAAGAKSDGSSGDSSAGRGSNDKTIHLSGAMNCSNLTDFSYRLDCIANNANVISSFVSSQKKNACLQLQETVYALANTLPYIGDNTNKIDFNTAVTECTTYNSTGSKTCKGSSKPDDMNKCISQLQLAVTRAKFVLEQEKNKNRYRY